MEKSIIGTGIFNLDIVVKRDYPQWPAMRPFEDKVVLEEVGGTCGNVMSILARMGWNVRPIACLDDSPEGLKITEDLKRYGCDCQYVTNTPAGGTTILRCTHKKDKEGNHTMSVRAGSPGGSRFPKRHFLRARDEAQIFLDQLIEMPSVFFFDDPAAGNRLIAKGMRARGALVYFEPSKVSGNAELDAIKASDIIKFSDENVPDVSFADDFRDKVFIQTMGARGVRYKYKSRPWVFIEGKRNDNVVDTEGAGDWFTAAFLNELGDRDSFSIGGYTSVEYGDMMREAQEMASRSVGYLGSKGMFSGASSSLPTAASSKPSR